MAEGRSLSKNYYTANEGGQSVDIAMPPVNQATAMHAAPNPWENNQSVHVEQGDSPFAPVPDMVPEDVLDEMSTTEETPDYVEEAVQEPIDKVPVKDNSARDNLVRMRIAREKAERERDELMQILLKQQSNQQQVPEPEEDYGIGNEELAEGKHIRKVSKELADLKKQLASYKAQSQQEILEAKIRLQFPDFNQVVSEENVSRLKEDHPEVAEMLINTADLYNKASSAYKVIKNFGIHKETIVMTRDKAQAAQALKNIAKPKPMASINPQQGDTPLSKANAFATPGALTDDMKAQLRKEMEQARRGF